MNFEIFNTQEELDARVNELRGVAIEIITNHNGRVFTLMWK